jgi:hypothetical protein
VGVLLLAAAAGLNPWMVLFTVAGLATFTRHAALAGPLEPLQGVPHVVGLGLLLGIELVVSKVRRTAELAESVNLLAGGIAGALLATGLWLGTGEAPPAWLAAPGAAAALGVRLLRRRVTRAVREALRPWAHVAVGMGSDVAAGATTAALFALKP